MITKIFIYNAQGTYPHENLAAEKVLMDALGPGEAMLYLWQNLNTVVIGKNQNAWLECRTSLLEEEGGKLSCRCDICHGKQQSFKYCKSALCCKYSKGKGHG